MKLYVFPQAPNPRKVLVYLKEKALDVPLEHVALDPRFANVARWYAAFRQRPSAAA